MNQDITPVDDLKSIEQQIAALEAKKAKLVVVGLAAAPFKDSEGNALEVPNPRSVDDKDKAATLEYQLDTALLRSAGTAMEHRLHTNRAAGKTGWFASTDRDPLAAAKDQIEKGQLVDAMLYLAMANAKQSIAA